MKLAEALQERASLNRKIEELRVRILNSSLVQEGEKPSEDPKELLKEYDACIERLEYLISAINLSNTKILVRDVPLTKIIARKDVLLVKAAAYKDIADRASRSAERARNSEIRILPCLSVKDLQKKIDRLSEEIRKLDNSLQEANWSHELIEE